MINELSKYDSSIRSEMETICFRNHVFSLYIFVASSVHKVSILFSIYTNGYVWTLADLSRMFQGLQSITNWRFIRIFDWFKRLSDTSMWIPKILRNSYLYPNERKKKRKRKQILIRNGICTYHSAHSMKSLANARLTTLGGDLPSSTNALRMSPSRSSLISSCTTSARPCMAQQWIGISPCIRQNRFIY